MSFSSTSCDADCPLIPSLCQGWGTLVREMEEINVALRWQIGLKYFSKFHCYNIVIRLCENSCIILFIRFLNCKYFDFNCKILNQTPKISQHTSQLSSSLLPSQHPPLTTHCALLLITVVTAAIFAGAEDCQRPAASVVAPVRDRSLFVRFVRLAFILASTANVISEHRPINVVSQPLL